MTPPLTVAALAVADGPADAVGVVQLACEEASLALTLLRAGAYRRDFVPGSLAEAVTVHVPYSAVRGLVRRSRALVLTLDRSVPTPFHRFALARFTDDPAETLAPVHRAHRLASTLAWALPGPIGALAAALPPADLVGGALGRAAVALLVALAAGASMRALAAWLAWGGPSSDRLREAFETAVSERLGLLPAPAPTASTRALARRTALGSSAAPMLGSGAVAPPDGAAPMLPLGADAPPDGAAPMLPRGADAPPDGAAPMLPSGRGNAPTEPPRLLPIAAPPALNTTPPDAPQVPWARLVGLAGVAALGVVIALAFVKRYGTTSLAPAPEIDDTVEAERAPEAPKPPPEPAPPPPPREDRCFCERAASSLWKDGMPVLTVMTTTGPDGTLATPTPKLDEHDNPMFSYDVAVVNNGAQRIRETRIVLTYARRDEQNRRVAVTDRGLYWGLPLAPGAAVKWTTEGPGTEVRIDKSELGTLESRHLAAAPADAFVALLRARHRVVRQQGATMLAYLHDPRAESAVERIGAASAAEAPLVRRLRAAARPIIACDIRAEDDKLTACIFNASTKAETGLSLREISDDEAKPGRAWPVAAEVPVHDGVRVKWPLDGEVPSDVAVTAEP